MTTTGHDLATAALAYEGFPYVFGAKGPAAFDCSGLVWQAARDVGVSVPHGSANQDAAFIRVPLSQGVATPGAVLYRPGHNGISLGDGRTIEARNPQLGVSVAAYTWGNFTHAGLIPGINYGQEEDVSRPTFVSPTRGRVTSRWGPRAPLPYHWGLDVAPPTPGQTGVPIHAPLAGTVVAVRSGGGNTNPITGPYNSGSYVKVNTTAAARAASGVAAYWIGHPVNISVRVGQSLRAGDRIANQGAVGNVTGIHLHLEFWSATSRSPINPEPVFAKFGITPGSAPVLGGGGGSPTPPERSWLEMATKDEVKEAFREVLAENAMNDNHQRVSIITALSRLLTLTRDMPKSVWQFRNDTHDTRDAWGILRAGTRDSSVSAEMLSGGMWEQQVRVTGSSARKLNRPDGGTIRAGALQAYAATGGYAGPSYEGK